MAKFTFVVLHFNIKSIIDTQECVNSILDIASYNNKASLNVVIVENGSSDNSCEELTNHYKDNNSVFVLCSDSNLGFSKGNNLGIDYAKANYSPDFIVVLNNDTIVESRNLVDIIETEYQKYTFDILGPRIRNLRNIEQNPPLYKPQIKAKDLKLSLDRLKILQSDLSTKKLRRVIEFTKNIIRKSILYRFWFNYKHNKRLKKTTNSTNVFLHGSALVISRSFLQKNEHLFTPISFMFFEEDILYYNVIKNNYKSIYCPKISILHKEDVSTNYSHKSPTSFIIEKKIESLENFLKYINNAECGG